MARRSRAQRKRRRNILLGGAALGVGGIALASRGGSSGGSSGSVGGSSIPNSIPKKKSLSLGTRKALNRQRKLVPRQERIANIIKGDNKASKKLGKAMDKQFKLTGNTPIRSDSKLGRKARDGFAANAIAEVSGGRKNASKGIAERIHQKSTLPFAKSIKSESVDRKVSNVTMGFKSTSGKKLSSPRRKALRKLGLRPEGGFKPGTSKRAKQKAARIMKSMGRFSRQRRLSYL